MLVLNPPFPIPVRRLFYDGVPLIPVEGKTDVWVLPCGLGVRTTAELLRRAKKQGVHCCLFVRSAIGERDE